MTIRELKAQGKSIRQIADITGHSRNTVRKYLRAKGLPERKQPPPRPSKLEPFEEYLRARMAEGVINCVVLLREIRRLGYKGGKSILKEFVKPLRPPRQPRAVMRFEVLPGEQAQVDWAEFSYLDEQGRKRRVYAFVMLLSYSREIYLEFVERTNLSTFLRCHVHAFEHFGGVPRTILYDNAKVVRLGRDTDGRPVFNSRLLDFALVVGFHPRLCRPYRAQTKGRVERAIKYAKDNFWPGRKFTTVTDLNQQALAWCAEVGGCWRCCPVR